MFKPNVQDEDSLTLDLIPWSFKDVTLENILQGLTDQIRPPYMYKPHSPSSGMNFTFAKYSGFTVTTYQDGHHMGGDEGKDKICVHIL